MQENWWSVKRRWDRRDKMNEDDFSRWEVPHYSHPEKDSLEECRAEKIVSNSRSSNTHPFHILAEESRTGSTGNTTRWSKRSRNNASSTGNCAVDIVPDPAARNGPRDSSEAAAYYFHPSRRFGKLSFEICDKLHPAPRRFENNKLLNSNNNKIRALSSETTST